MIYTAYILPPGDIDAMLKIENASFITPWQRQDIEGDLNSNPCARYMGIYDEGRLIGWGCVWLKMNEAHLMTVAIEPSRRGEGHGKTLTKALMQAASDGGAVFIELECRRANTVAQKMYNALGFIRVGIRKGYYTDTGDDAFIYAHIALPKANWENDPYITHQTEDTN